ncbi:hypothetical protein [Pseudovibrio sp. JE062]|uniref:hypothetical protein n=1 Tax=Pseudovibrio sp. JE062 TaxID=439495 RepID=UPI0002EC3C81|nr:hypothetical protein [Pseudovibrio sp. JE062]
MRNSVRTLWRASALSFLMFSAASAQQTTLEFNAKESDGFSVESKALYPEGLEYDAKRERFLLGSIRKGEVIALNKDGTATRLVDDERLRSVVGIRVDAERGRLLVNSSDYGVATRSAPSDKFASVSLGIYDLATGAPLKFIDLSDLKPAEKKFANDLTVDADGNAYITDSLAASIYKVTPSGKASVFLSHERFRGDGFNLNGIQYHKNGYLLVAKKSDGSLFKVPLNDPSAFTEVAMPQPLVGTDGLVLAGPDELIAITNRASGVVSNTVFQLLSDDDWSSATIGQTFKTGDVYPTTGVVAKGKLYVNYGHLHTLSSALTEGDELKDTFHIQQVGSE